MFIVSQKNNIFNIYNLFQKILELLPEKFYAMDLPEKILVNTDSKKELKNPVKYN